MDQGQIDDAIDERALHGSRSDTADVRLCQRSEHIRLEFHGALAALLVADVMGSICLAILIFGINASSMNYGREQLWTGIAGFGIAWSVSAWSQSLYLRRAMFSSLRRVLIRAASTAAFAFGLMLLMAFALKMTEDLSRVWLLTWAGSVVLWVCASRLLWCGFFARQLELGGCLDRALVLAGSSAAARSVAQRVESESGGHIRVVTSAMLPGTPGGPTVEWVEEAVRDGVVDRIIVAHFEPAMGETNALLARLSRLAIHVTLIPDLNGLRAPILNIDRIGSLPAIDLHSCPLSPMQCAVKRAEDLLLGGLFLILLSPVLLLLAAAIKLDSPGPIFFRQPRAGFHGRVFTVWKFRTMRHEACDEDSVRQTSRDDERVTRIGRRLRRTSMDELPQLLNVLGGTMSIVGPRPHALGMTATGRPIADMLDGYSARHRLKPGITGWAQVNGCRGEVDTEEKLRQRVELDCHYIESWSLALDAWIILRTAALVLVDANAY